MGKSNVPTDVFKNVDMATPDECWPWKGKINSKDQRPYITIEGVRRAAYVIVYELYSGEQAMGRYILHSCDNSVCCNPHHLSWGSHQDNMDDMVSMGRQYRPIGVKNWATKLSDAEVIEIRSLPGLYRDIGAIYGIAPSTVGSIKRRENWNHI